MLHVTPVQTTAQLQKHSPHMGMLGHAKVINGCPNRHRALILWTYSVQITLADFWIVRLYSFLLYFEANTI
jgi:hypothetical protein